jgi:hypothetical protein
MKSSTPKSMQIQFAKTWSAGFLNFYIASEYKYHIPFFDYLLQKRKAFNYDHVWGAKE